MGSYVKGFQTKGVMTVAKHFGLNSQETDRDFVNAIVPDARALFEVYHVPYKAAVAAGAAAFMCSYNLVNGSHACSSGQLLGRDLKTAMAYEGFVMSDWWAAHNTSAAQGLDMEMPGNAPPGKDGPFLSPDALEAAGLTQEPTTVIDDMDAYLGLHGGDGPTEGGAYYPPVATPRPTPTAAAARASASASGRVTKEEEEKKEEKKKKKNLRGNEEDEGRRARKLPLEAPTSEAGAAEIDAYLYDANATSAAHAELALRIATQSVTLLKNDGGCSRSRCRPRPPRLRLRLRRTPTTTTTTPCAAHRRARRRAWRRTTSTPCS